MSTIVTRAGKGSPLTHTEVDNNFTNLNTDKAEDSTVVKLTGDQIVAGTKTFSSTISGSISGNAGTVTDGVVTTGSYANPSWITSLDDGKVLPSMAGNSGKYLTTDGTNSSWDAVTVSLSGTAPISYSSGVISISQATTSTDGYLSSTDWNTFNGKYSTGGALGTPSSGTLTNCTFPTLNQNTTGSSGSIAVSGGWAVTPSGTKLYFAYNGVNKGSLDSSGNFIVVGNVTAYGTP